MITHMHICCFLSINKIGHCLNQMKRRQIVFVEELDNFDFLLRTGDLSKIDLSFLSHYTNVNFVLCRFKGNT